MYRVNNENNLTCELYLKENVSRDALSFLFNVFKNEVIFIFIYR